MFDFCSSRQFADKSSPRIVSSCREQQGLESRQRDIYESHRHRAFSLAYYMTGNEVEAEQILTGTFVRAFTAAPEPEGRDVDSALLEELCQRSHLDRDSALPAPSPETLGSTADLAGRNIKRTDIEEALWALPAAERLLFLLRDVEGYSPAAIAQLLNLQEAEVQRGLFAARLRMRRVLAEANREEEKKAA